MPSNRISKEKMDVIRAALEGGAFHDLEKPQLRIVKLLDGGEVKEFLRVEVVHDALVIQDCVVEGSLNVRVRDFGNMFISGNVIKEQNGPLVLVGD